MQILLQCSIGPPGSQVFYGLPAPMLARPEPAPASAIFAYTPALVSSSISSGTAVL